MTDLFAQQIFDLVSILVIAYFIVLNLYYLVMSIVAFSSLRRFAIKDRTIELEEFLVSSGGALPITLIAPAFNEEATCVESVKSFLALQYPSTEVIVVNDGSTDATVAKLVEAFDMVLMARFPTSTLPCQRVRGVYQSSRIPTLWLLDKENGGKADALNAGLNYCRTPLFAAMDADTLLERDALLRVVRPFLEDSRTIASGGIIRIINGCTVKKGQVTEVGIPKEWLARFQVLEYLRAFLSGRVGWDAIEGTLIISGAFGVFRRSAVEEVGGYALDTVGEDMELVVRLHRRFRELGQPYRVAFVPDPVAWTECPVTLRVLARQRDRWQRGLMDSLSRHRKMLLNPRYGVIGVLAYPYFYFLEMLGPVVELCGYIVFVTHLWLGLVSGWFVWAFLGLAIFLGMVLSLAAVGLEELSFRRYPKMKDLMWLFVIAILENFGYRQLCTIWRVKGVWSFLRRVKGWGVMTRRGFAPS